MGTPSAPGTSVNAGSGDGNHAGYASVFGQFLARRRTRRKGTALWQQLARAHHPRRRGAALVKFRPRTVKRAYRESTPNARTAAAPWARGMPQRRFQPQRLNARSAPGVASH
jgi:hypothetical protein